MTTSTNSCLLYSIGNYSAVLGLWPLEELSELADGPTGRGELARGGCLCAWDFSVTRSFVHVGGGGIGQTNMTLSLHQWLAPSLPFEKYHAPETNHCTILGLILEIVIKSSRLSCCWLKNGNRLPHRESKWLYSVHVSGYSCCS